ncbi:MAG: hypothetical protein WCK78_04260 [Paludibacter sp.]
MKDRFLLQKSELKQNHWVCTDRENLIVCTFENHKFNETQKFDVLENFNSDNFMQLARIMREFGDWLSENHYDKVF